MTQPSPAPVPAPGIAPALGAEELRRLLATAAAGARGFVVAIGAGRYLEASDTAALVIADEQRKFNGDRAVYLHLSPPLPHGGLAPHGPEPIPFEIALDGALRGIATAGAVGLALASLAAGPLAALPRLLVVHALAGHRPEAIAALAACLRPRHAFFWLHDHAVACGNPLLLRNDIAFCHAPPPASIACRICRHGPARPAHIARVRALFEAVRFHVVAPSAEALALFRQATDLPSEGLLVHPHLRLAPADTAPPPTCPDGKVRVAFVGPATVANGWPRFAALVARVAGDAAFVQVGGDAASHPLPGVAPLVAARAPNKPFAVVRALAEHRIDFLLALAIWPEPFPTAAFEARAAGADILTTGPGLPAMAEAIVLADDAALAEFFASGRAAAHAHARRAAAAPPPVLQHAGSTATIALGEAVAPITEAPDVHLLLRGARLDGTQTGGTQAGGTWRFTLPPAEPADARRMVRLRSRHLRGAWDRAAEGERRRLGIAVTALALDGTPVPPNDPRRAGGWHKPDADWQWTDGDAGLIVGTAQCLDIEIRPLGRYWRVPLLLAAP